MSSSSTMCRPAHGAFIVAACWPFAAVSQTATTPAGAPDNQVQTVVVTGNPLRRSDGTQPVSVLAGDGLLLRRGSTLGEALDGLPGVSATSFGPNSSRPTIRGLDGDRVRVLDNGGASIDASSLSFDHAVAIDSLVVERLEVLRGPAALLYGGSATGGVVNTIDNRIPRTPLTGLGGRAEWRFGGAAAERSAAAVVEGGQGGLAWHVDAFGRRTSDLRVPSFTPIEGGQALPATARVRNSAAKASGGSLGVSTVGTDHYAGLSVDTYRNDYGVTVEPDVTLRMKRDRVSAAGQWRRLGGPIAELSFNAVHTDYQHQEFEGPDVGTTFASRGRDIRLEARHRPIGSLDGVVGIQVESMRFSALGEEAFVPGTQTRSSALFVVEEWRNGPLTLSAGARVERVRVASDGDAADALESRFGTPQTRRFSPRSVSTSARWAVANGVTLNASLARTQRAPAYYELFANGLHVATAAAEVGDPTLGVESSRHAELGAQWTRGGLQLKVQAFTTRFANYVALDATGASFDEVGADGETTSYPVYAFRGVRARLQGAELDGRWQVSTGTRPLALSAGLDLVRGDNLDAAEPLARLAPLRGRLGIETSMSGLRFGGEVRHAARQSRVPADDAATPSWTTLGLWVVGDLGSSKGFATWYLRADNLTDELAYAASSVATVRGLAPLPGRSLSVGLRLAL